MKVSLIKNVLTDLETELNRDFEVESVQVIENKIKVLYKITGSRDEELLTYSADIKIVE
jgi:hypothetical protein